MAEKTQPKSRFFRVAVEGATTDGRVIEANWIDEMAANYDPVKTFGALVNIEHIKGYSGEPPFNNYGKVLALEARDFELRMNGKAEKRRALYAQIEANDQLIALNHKGQKLYSSIEVNPNFAGKGQAYFMGLAVTDNPASLGTELLAFSASAGTNPFANRKQNPGNLFTAIAADDQPVELVFEDAPSASGGNSFSLDTFLEAAAVKFGFKQAPTEAAATAAPASTTPSAEHVAAFAELGQGVKAMAEKFGADLAAIRASHDQLQSEVTRLTADLSASPGSNYTARPPATGGDSSIQTDF